MIELNSVWGILIIECFIGLLLLVIIFSMLSKKKKSSEHAAIDSLIDKLEDSEKIKAKKLSKIILQYCEVKPDELKGLLGGVSQSEQQLYKQILHVFLNRDIGLLDDLDLHIEQMSEAYLKMLAYSSANTNNGSAAIEQQDKMAEDEGEVKLLTIANQRLGEQLTEAMATMDEISAEYTRVFSGTQSAEELKVSKDNMFKIFKHAEQRVKLTLKKKE